jgi:hypothetical protein
MRECKKVIKLEHADDWSQTLLCLSEGNATLEQQQAAIAQIQGLEEICAWKDQMINQLLEARDTLDDAIRAGALREVKLQEQLETSMAALNTCHGALHRMRAKH